MPVTVSVDNERRVVDYLIWGPVAGPEFIESMTTAIRSNPEVADYDGIFDVIGYTGDVTTDDMASVAMLMNDYRTDASGLARTALITHDPGFADWAQLMSHQFERRQFGVFGSRAASEAWLESGQPERQAA